MAEKEIRARSENIRFSFESDERSSRTGGQIWHELIVETDDGPLKQLLAIDGKPLSVTQALEERKRLMAQIASPSSLHNGRAAIEVDEKRLLTLLQTLPQAFLFAPVGTEEGCSKFQFRPNPSFRPSTIEERALQVLIGNLSVKEPEDRLCRLDGKFERPVDFGFGLLGHLDQDSHFLVKRELVSGLYWKSTRIAIHIQGKLLMMKSLSKDQDVSRTGVRLLPAHLTLQEATMLLR